MFKSVHGTKTQQGYSSFPGPIIASMRQRAYLASVHIKDAYLNTPTYPPHLHFLYFAIGDNPFQSSPNSFWPIPSVRFSKRVFSLMVASFEAVPYAQFHLRPLLHNILLAQNLQAPYASVQSCKEFLSLVDLQPEQLFLSYHWEGREECPNFSHFRE